MAHISTQSSIGFLIRAALLLAAAPVLPNDALQREVHWKEPRPLSVGKLRNRALDDAYDQVANTFALRRILSNHNGSEARNVNSAGEVPDSAWFENRHWRNRMTTAELERGPGNNQAPDPAAPWEVLSVKDEGATPGLRIRDRAGRRYLLKFDPRGYPGLSTGADVLGSKIFFALGYHTPENYIVRFHPDQLRIPPQSSFTDQIGRRRQLSAPRLKHLLERVATLRDGRIRALASLYVSGELIGPWRYHGTRRDDPNDVIPHEDRREIRGLRLLAAWLNHYDTTSLNTLDSIVTDPDGTRWVKHYLIDFGSILGASALGPKDPRNGFVYQWDLSEAATKIATLGLLPSPWQKAKYPNLPGIGNLEAEQFHPISWRPIYPNPAFERCTPSDLRWAARKVAAFTDEDLAVLVATAQLETGEESRLLLRLLIERRDRIAKLILAGKP